MRPITELATEIEQPAPDPNPTKEDARYQLPDVKKTAAEKYVEQCKAMERMNENEQQAQDALRKGNIGGYNSYMRQANRDLRAFYESQLGIKITEKDMPPSTVPETPVEPIDPPWIEPELAPPGMPELPK